MKQLTNTYHGLPSWAKGVIAVGLTGAAIYGGIKLYKFVKKMQIEKDSAAVAIAAESEYQKLKKAGAKLSFPETSYQSAINTIVKYLNGCETFTSEMNAAMEVMKVVKTPVDWYYLIQKFGKKDIDDCVYGKTNYDLTTLLKDQLDSAGMFKVNVNGFADSGFTSKSSNILAKYLSTKGITL